MTGIAVVTFDAPVGEHRGITVNSFTSVSLEPQLILVSIARAARCHDALTSAIPFCVNVLAAEQEALARRFAGSGDVSIRWVDGLRAPRLGGVLAHFECEPWSSYDGGDHTLLIGRIVDFDFREGDALGFFASRFTPVADLRPGHEDLI